MSNIDIEKLLNQSDDSYKARTEAENQQNDARILKTKIGGTYWIRFVPNARDPLNSRVAYSEFGWKSPIDGSYVYAGRDPSDEKDANGRPKVKDEIVTKTKWAEFKKAKDNGTDKAPGGYKLLNPRRKELVNVYLHKVEGDEAAASKVGKVLVFRFPAQRIKDKKTDQMVPSSDILSKIEEALYGDKKAKIGRRMWKLDATGRSFVLKVTEKADYPNYSKSEFDDAEDLGLTTDQINDIMLTQAHNLLEFVPEVKSQDELRQLLDAHYFGTIAAPSDNVDVPESEDEDDLIPGLGAPSNSDDDEDFLAGVDDD